MSVNFLSLFAGIGGFDLGLERAGWTCVGQVEIDPFCQRVLAKHWPHVKRMGDIRLVRGDEFGEVDAICGGFPCQDISNAGNKVGITGERSGLWSEFYRLIRTIRPSFVIVENVSALLERDIARVLGDLAAIGYGAEWHCIPASYVGAPHIRDRVWIVAYADQNRCVSSPIFENGIQAEKLSCVWEPFRTNDFRVRVQELARVCGLDDGVPEELGAYGNAVVPQVAEYIGRQIMSQKL